MKEQQGLIPIKDVLESYLDSRHHREFPGGVPTGLIDLDRMTEGLQPTDLIVLAGVAGVGKTTLALNIARNATVRFNQGVAFFSLQQPSYQIAERLLTMESSILAPNIRYSRLHEQDLAILSEVQKTFSVSPLYLDDTPDLTAAEIADRTQKLSKLGPLDLLIIDSLHLIKGRNRAQDLKKLAQETNVPVLVTSPLTKAVDRRSYPKPRTSDLPGGRETENAADLILLMYQLSGSFEWDVDTDISERRVVHMAITKHRQGPKGEITFGYNESYFRFINLMNERVNQFTDDDGTFDLDD